MKNVVPFKSVQSNFPRRSVHNLSYSKLFTCDFGQLIPVVHDFAIPGDIWRISNEMVIRFNPLVAPVLHEVRAYTHYYFVPCRILQNTKLGDTYDWEEFFSGGATGNSVATEARWALGVGSTAKGTLWDYLGLPVGFTPDDNSRIPTDLIRRAYYLIWNEYYRDETLQDPLDITDAAVNHHIMQRNWEKDYFTSALPFQQRGTAPALPLSGTTSAIWDDDVLLGKAADGNNFPLSYFLSGTPYAVDSASQANASHDVIPNASVPVGPNVGSIAVNQPVAETSKMNDNTVDFADATTFNVADLRLAFQVQKWMERNARAGVRYKELIQAHWGVFPRDDRLQRPEYFGGSMAPVIFSEVLQTSNNVDDNAPQGNMAGHGISVNRSYCGSYHVKEPGWIIGLMSVMPRPMYMQGINKQYIYQSRLDYPWPEFCNLSEQPIEEIEIMASNVQADNRRIFGYQGRYDELRYKPNLVCADMRDTFSYWHMARIFATQPALDDPDFLPCVPDKRILADQNGPAMIVHYGNLIKAIRPIPISAEPGLIDHG